MAEAAAAPSEEPPGQDVSGLENEMDATTWTREEHYHFLKALQQYGEARKTMPVDEWLQKIADAVGSRSLEETREHIQEYFQATNHEGVMPSSLMSMHEQQYNNQPVQIIHPNAIIECAMPLPIQQPPRLSPRCFARIKQQQQTLLGAYCSAAEWTREEQIVLEEGLKRFPASQYNNLTRYVKIAAFLPDKTITDVARRYKWMVELQRLNSVNFSDGSESDRAKLPGSPSESSTLHQATGGGFDPTGARIETVPSAADAMASDAAAAAPARAARAAAAAPAQAAAPKAARDGQDTVTSENGVLRLLDENDGFIAQVKQALEAQQAAGGDGPPTLDGDIMEHMIRFRSNLSNVLNCLAMVSGCMSKMPPLLVKLHPLPLIQSEADRRAMPGPAGGGGAAAAAAPPELPPAARPAAAPAAAAEPADAPPSPEAAEETTVEMSEVKAENGGAAAAAGAGGAAAEAGGGGADEASSPSDRRSKRKRKRREH